tara:strand:- start:28324 stop:30189 length:1866 start_codon:yes stop_codon:yes gene_type:complete
MKKHILLVMLLVSTLGFAQNGISYKALIKDDLGNVIANSSIDIKFKILESDAQVNVYEETHSPTTDDNGIVIINIGEGAIVSGNFGNINWGNDDHYLNVRIDSGSGYVDLGTVQFSAVPYAFHAKKAANVKGLEPLDEGNGVGWRLADRNPINYGDIGYNAIDLSFSSSGLIEKGALGLNSFATGFFTTASGDYATSMGYNTEASGDYSTSLGYNTETIGDYAFASGRNSSANGNHATAIGYSANASGGSAIALGRNAIASNEDSFATGIDAIASGENSIAIGRRAEALSDGSTAIGSSANAGAGESTAIGVGTRTTGIRSTALGAFTHASGEYAISMGTSSEASGTYSTTMGYNTNAPSWGETVIGAYNIPYTPNSTTSWNSNDRLFVVANGRLVDNIFYRRNALTVLKNGNIGIGTSIPQERLHINNGRLRIGDETIEDGGNDVLAFSSSLVPTVDGEDRIGGPNRKWLDIYATNGTIQTSDRREKKNIKDLSYGLAEVLKMNPVSFNWKNRKNKDTKLGLIAQDLLDLIPEVVMSHEWKKISDDKNATLEKVELDRLGVYYSDLIPVLINAIKEQQKLISNQDSKIAGLSAEVKDLNNLKTRIKNIETLLKSTNQLNN